MNKFWRRVTGPFREFGPGAGTLYALDRVLKQLSPRLGLGYYELVMQPVPEQPLLKPERAGQLRVEPIGRGHPALLLMPVPAFVIESRFAQGAECIGVWRQDELLGYIWFCFGQYQEDEVRCTYVLAQPEGSAFDFDLYVFPEHRMGIGFMAIWHSANEFLRQRNIKATFSRITRFNLASRRAHARLGARRIGRMLFLKLWGLEFILAGVAPFLAVSWPGRRGPRLQLTPPVR